MRRLFVPPGALDTPEVRIQGPDFHHLVRVLRVKPGEPIILLDGVADARHSVVESISKRDLIARVTGAAPYPPRPPIEVAVAQALGKGDRFEQVIQHATEVGASAFIPLLTERTVVKLEVKSVGDKVERWAAIAKGAAEQSGRGEIPRLESPADLHGILVRLGEFKLAVLLDASGEPLRGILSNPVHVEQSPCILLVGPEGGFAPEEIQAARDAGAQVASIGPYILRTETAAVAALSQLLFWFAGEHGWTTSSSMPTPSSGARQSGDACKRSR